jgi:cell division protein FtsW
MPKRTAPDRWLAVTTGLLVFLGLFMVGSSSHYLAMSLGQSPYHYLLRHSIYVVLGALALFATMRLPYRKLDDRRLVLCLVAVTLAALVAVLAMPAAGGARRWFPMGIASVQPSEIAKLVIILLLAYLLSHREERVNELRTVPAPCLAVTGVMAALIAIEPDLGSALMVAVLMGVMLFVAGLRWSYIGAVAGAGAVGIAVAVLAEPYRIERIRTFLHPEADLQGSGFQLWQSLIALGNGGTLGVGLGQGQQKAFYLPAAHTDFIFSVVGEELGLVGTALLLVGFTVLFWRGMRAALRAPDRFGFYLALGVTSLLTIQALIHMAVCLGLFPTKGLPCPFISYGGSSLVASMAAAGLLLNVSQHSS